MKCGPIGFVYVLCSQGYGGTCGNVGELIANVILTILPFMNRFASLFF